MTKAKKKPNTISKKWKKLSASVLGDSRGRHCHWCSFIRHKDGESDCTNPKSKWFEADNIRSMEGHVIAQDCSEFKLDKWYTDDKHFDDYFSRD